jgi:aspartate carbamoyltransferase catalytic subunit
MQRLGGSVIHVDGKGNSSAGKKGETLSDTIRSLECYADATVLRHPDTGSVGQVAVSVTKPILNAGDGTGEHPRKPSWISLRFVMSSTTSLMTHITDRSPLYSWET